MDHGNRPPCALQKRLAADILKCGKRRLRLEPTVLSRINEANSRTFILACRIKDMLLTV